jgi:protein tyrosine phosphatase (PTP) superfamily phosphohydrolase (DUF442 family)
VRASIISLNKVAKPNCHWTAISEPNMHIISEAKQCIFAHLKEGSRSHVNLYVLQNSVSEKGITRDRERASECPPIGN